MSFLLAAWAFVSSPIGRVLTTATVMLAIGFTWGFDIRGRMDRSATQQAVITKQRIDLRAAQESADQANTVIIDISARDADNQEVIRDLQSKLAQRPAGDRCTLSPADADSLRRLR